MLSTRSWLFAKFCIVCVVLLITLRLDKEIWGLKVLNFACKNKHVSISGLTNVPHFNSTIVLFLCRKLLEDLVNRNVQQTVELNHWKKMCEEYSEESDRLEIECDVWRTKFLASR